jgi:hypothetical protein
MNRHFLQSQAFHIKLAQIRSTSKMLLVGVVLSTLVGVSLCHSKPLGQPFLKAIDTGTHVIGNDIWNITIGRIFGKQLWYKNHELVGGASGHYVSYSKLNSINSKPMANGSKTVLRII